MICGDLGRGTYCGECIDFSSLRGGQLVRLSDTLRRDDKVPVDCTGGVGHAGILLFIHRQVGVRAGPLASRGGSRWKEVRRQDGRLIGIEGVIDVIEKAGHYDRRAVCEMEGERGRMLLAENVSHLI